MDKFNYTVEHMENAESAMGKVMKENARKLSNAIDLECKKVIDEYLGIDLDITSLEECKQAYEEIKAKGLMLVTEYKDSKMNMQGDKWLGSVKYKVYLKPIED